MSRFARRARPWIAVVLVVALLVPVGRWAADELAFGSSRDAVEEALGDDAALAAAMLLVRSVGCTGAVSTGSAFVLEVDGTPTVVTNRHVVDGARSVSLRPLAGDSAVVSVERHLLARDADVAVLELEAGIGMPPALAAGPPVDVGASVRVVGFPSGRPSTSTGTVVDAGPGRLVVDADVSAGVSGSPLLDDDGRVVGQVFGTTVHGEGVATPIQTVLGAASRAEEPAGC